jgi:hypothetical protein
MPSALRGKNFLVDLINRAKQKREGGKNKEIENKELYGNNWGYA